MALVGYQTGNKEIISSDGRTVVPDTYSAPARVGLAWWLVSATIAADVALGHQLVLTATRAGVTQRIWTFSPTVAAGLTRHDVLVTGLDIYIPQSWCKPGEAPFNFDLTFDSDDVTAAFTGSLVFELRSR